ncbi:hypothetical protein PanWU01x14_198800 [Parasponia andersonii]|uniref:DUF4216 domain-containing protein n=1 Tax=Parasponia andersonii TaxID=3476 RepID=A0A2P5BYJ6_PARAD|nr:hypothetical protein PanWU01x14_198800 [Parasponia andersonii]
MFYIDDILNGPRWKVVEHFRHRNIWDIPKPNTNDGDMVTNDFEVFQDDNSSNFFLVVDLPELGTFLYNHNYAQPQSVQNEKNIFKIVKHDDTFIDDDIEPNDTLEEYNNDEPLEQIHEFDYETYSDELKEINSDSDEI